MRYYLKPDSITGCEEISKRKYTLFMFAGTHETMEKGREYEIIKPKEGYEVKELRI